jgi:hypothetical protein
MLSSHTETLSLVVVSVGYPVILGLDWLCKHNPKVDWTNMDLTLKCCNLHCLSPVSVKAQGFKPELSQPTTSLNAFVPMFVGFGFGLHWNSLAS